MEHYLPIASIVGIAVFGYLISEYLRLMRCVNDLDDLVDALRQAHNQATMVIGELVPEEEKHLKERLNFIVTVDDFQE